jgi:hypothetical protein
MNAKSTASATFGAGAVAAMIYGITQVAICQRASGYQACKDEWALARPLIAGGGAAIVGLFMPQPKIPHGSEPAEQPTPRRRREEDNERPVYFPPIEEIMEPVAPNVAPAAEPEPVDDVATRMERAYRRLQASRRA